VKLPDQFGDAREIRRPLAQLPKALATELAKRVVELRGMLRQLRKLGGLAQRTQTLHGVREALSVDLRRRRGALL